MIIEIYVLIVVIASIAICLLLYTFANRILRPTNRFLKGIKKVAEWIVDFFSGFG